MATTTLKAILEALCDDYGLGRYGTASAGGTGSITDDVRFGGSEGAAGIDAGCAVFITSNANSVGNAPENEETRLASRPKLSTGVMTLDPAVTAAIETSDVFAIAYKPLTFESGSGPYAIIPKLNQVLTEFQWEKRVKPITLVADGDMRAAAITAWTAVNAGTPTKVAASFPNAERVVAVTDSGSGGGYLSTGNMAVEPSSSYYLETLGFGTDASDAGELRVIDVTNSGATISITNSVIDRIEPERLINSFSTPSGCEQIDIRLISTTANDVVSWAYVILRKNDAREFVLTDSPQRALKLGRLMIPTHDKWGQRGAWTEVPSRMQALAAGLWQYTIEQSVAGQSLWYEEFVKPGSLTNSADTTVLPQEDIAAVTAEALLRPLRGRSKDWAIKYEFAMQRAAGVISRYLQQNETVVTAPRFSYPMLRA